MRYFLRSSFLLGLSFLIIHPSSFAQEKKGPPPPKVKPATAPAHAQAPAAKKNVVEANLELTPEERERQEKLSRVKNNIQVRWFKPEVTIEKNDPNFEKPQKISIAGETKAGTRIYLQSNRVFKVSPEGKKEKIVLKENQVNFLPGVADRRGIFLFQLNLTQGNYEVAVSMVDPEAQSMSAAKVYTLVLGLTQGRASLSQREEGGEDPFKAHFDYFAAGLGLNYSVFNKTSDVPSELRFSSFKFPSLRLGYATTFSQYPDWRADASFLMAPGETKNGTRVNVQSGSYNWMILGGDALYSRPDWTKEWNGYRMRWAIRGGLQMHSLPFLTSVTTGITDQKVSMVNFNTVVAGGHIDILTDSEFSYAAQMRVAIPFLNFSNMNLRNPLSFDGSVGGIYRREESPWSYGLFWYGQWLQFNFNETDKFDNGSHSGKFDIMYSNIEFRTMYDF